MTTLGVILHPTGRSKQPRRHGASGRTSPQGEVSREQLDCIEQQVQCQLSGRLRDFRLKRESSGLVLRGRTPTYYAKQLAQHAVMAATELPIVRNEIEVSQAMRFIELSSQSP